MNAYFCGAKTRQYGILNRRQTHYAGPRVITYVEAITAELDGTIVFLYIYDKSEQSNISDSKLRELLESELL